jgi:ERCC4-type nuclease
VSDFKIIIDSREQHPFYFRDYEIINRKLATGDYSIEGLEHLLSVERKGSVSEIAGNFTSKRFQDVLGRLSELKYSYIVLESSWDDILKFPAGSNIPSYMWKKIKIRSPFLLHKISEIQTKYNIHFIVCNNKDIAKTTTLNILKRVYEIECRKKIPHADSK